MRQITILKDSTDLRRDANFNFNAIDKLLRDANLTISSQSSQLSIQSSQIASLTAVIDSLLVSKDVANAIVVTGVAGETISGGALVIIDENNIYKFDVSNEDMYGFQCGITLNSGILGDQIRVTVSGVNTEVTALSLGVQYAGTTLGSLSLTPPATGINQMIGIALTSTSILVHTLNPIITI